MNPDELDKLARLVADSLAPDRPVATGGTRAASRADSRAAGSWLPIPVRPEPPVRGSEPPVWSGAAQLLGDIAPLRGGERASAFRESTGEMTNLVRAAAAGRGAHVRGAPTGRTVFAGKASMRRGLSVAVPIGVSNRHVHLSPEHVAQLFGTALTSKRALTQPSQFAANESVRIEGPSGALERVRIVGPSRGATQVELSIADAERLGVAAPIAASGSLADSVGGVTLVGPAGKAALAKGVIVAERHLHLAVDDAARWGLRDGDRLDLRCGEGARATTWHGVLVRAGTSNATEFHLDADEAHACGVKSGDSAGVVGVHPKHTERRTLVTERDVSRLAAAGRPIPAGALLTPSARDRARALGLAGA